MKIGSMVSIEPMREEHIPGVLEIEKQVFLSPWPRNAYQREISQNRTAHYVVLMVDGEVAGYAGLWRLYEEAHITTIGVGTAHQNRGFGRALMIALIGAAERQGARWITLEVRASNDSAIRLYEQFGFKVIGRRRGYYTDNGEDAIVMWSDSIHSDRFQRLLLENRGRVGPDVTGLD
ncbi:MAG: ribosomal protein S18-alanine N-acetyltransferase [Candidatus Dormibacteria bacterium]